MKKKRKKRTEARRLKRVLVKIYPYTYGKYLEKKYNVLVGENETIDIDEPYILLGNHITNFDGIFLQHIIKKPISFIVNDKAFRVPILRIALSYLDMIAKKKFASDIKTVREIFDAKIRNEIICIFPEGKRCWDGITEPIVKSTATLIKSIKMPVVVASIKGGAATIPRWHDNRQSTGTICIDINKCLSVDDIAKMDVAQIHEKISKDLYNDEHDFVTNSEYTYTGKRLAAGMERLLFVCPKCNGISTLSSHRHMISCTCGYSQTFNEKYSFDDGRFDTIAKWANWQREYITEHISTLDDTEEIFGDHQVRLYTAKGNDILKLKDRGTISANKEMITFVGATNHRFAFADIRGGSIQANNAYEFDMDGITYRLHMHGRDNAFKYQLLSKILN